MRRFNLTFKGGILPGYTPEQARARLANFFGIDDSERVERFFSGEPVILRRNLDRKEGGDLYRKLREQGLETELVTVSEEPEDISPTPRASAGADEEKALEAEAPAENESKGTTRETRGMVREIRRQQPGQIDQSWAVPSRPLSTDKKKRSRASLRELKQAAQDRQSTAGQSAQREQSERTPALDAARRKAEEAERNRKAAEKAAKRKAEQEQRERIAAEQEAKRRAEEEERQRVAAEEAARRKAEEAERKRKAAEEAARHRAEEEERRRKAAEAEARRKAKEAERNRKAAEEAAKRKAEQEQRERIAAEQEAKRRAEEEERQRVAAEEAARRRAEEAERMRKAAEEAARHKAEEEERRRKAAEEEARRKAEEAERKRKAAEEAALRKAEEAERKRKAAEEEARRKAEEKRKREEEAARRRAEKAAEERRRRTEREAARQVAREAAAKRKAEREEAQRIAREKAAARKAARDAERQIAREQAAREKAQRAAAKQQAAAEAAERKALEKEQRLLAAAEAARQKAEEEHRRAEEAARLQAEREALRAERERERQEQESREKQAREDAKRARQLEEDRKRAEAQAAKREARERAEKERAARQHALAKEKAEQEAAARAAEQSHRELEEKTVSVAASKLTSDARVPVRQPTVRSKLDLPRRRGVSVGQRQPGAPNLFALHPFRATADIRQRSQRANQRWLTGTACALLAGIALLALGNYYRLLPAPSIPQGPQAMTADPAGNLYLWAGDTLYLHDRAGVGMRQVTAEELQLPEPVRSLTWLGGEGLLVTAGGNAADPNDPPDSLLCQLELNRCSQRWPGVDARGIAAHPRTGARYLASSQAGLLRKLDSTDQLVATATVPTPASPVLRLRDGLLFMNSREDHAVSVFRPDDAGFGQQLDEILLLPPAAIDAGQDRVIDFISLGEDWWVILASEDHGSTGVYRFDSQWNLLGVPALPEDFTATTILDWNGRALLLDPARPLMPKFNSEGRAEVPLEPDGLLATIEDARRLATLQARVWRTGLALLVLLCGAATLYAYVQRIRSRVYRRGTPRGAEPIDSIAGKVNWVAPATSRVAHFRRLGFVLVVVTIGGMMAAIGLQAGVSQLAALLVVSGSAAVSLYILYRSAPGHLGVDGASLVIVDHHNHYHIGAGPRVLYRNNFLMIDDILLFTGNSSLPVFDTAQLAAMKPAVEAGIRVERKVIWVHLLQSRHPLASAFLVSLVGAGVALALLAS